MATVDSVHEILMRQLPMWFKPVLEYIAIMRAYAAPLSGMENTAETIKQNFFIQTCDMATIEYYEKLFGITVRYGDTDEYRRERLMNRFNQTVPYTVWHLKERLTELFGSAYSLEVDEENLWIKIFVTSDRYGAVDLVRDLIFDWVPAHLYVYSNQEVTNYIPSDKWTGARVARTFEQTISPGGN